MKLVINKSYEGSFQLSKKAKDRYRELTGIDIEYTVCGLKRDDPNLIKLVEELGNEANYNNSILKIVEIPDDVNYQIVEFSRKEHVAEIHRTWH